LRDGWGIFSLSKRSKTLFILEFNWYRAITQCTHPVNIYLYSTRGKQHNNTRHRQLRQHNNNDDDDDHNNNNNNNNNFF